jgi:hypothetical protein
VKTSSSRKRTISNVVLVGMANPSTHLENKSVTTRMNLFPVGVRGYGLIKWQDITSNGLFGCRVFWGAIGLGPPACTVRRGDSEEVHDRTLSCSFSQWKCWAIDLSVSLALGLFHN